jgi:hypothetical protein
MENERDWWIGGFLVAFLIGLAVTLIYTWYLDPNAPTTTPSRLNLADKETYILLVAAAYRHDGNLEKANKRLARLKNKNINQAIVNLAEEYIATGADVRDIRSLVSLAAGLGETKGSMLVYLITPTSTPKPTATFTNTPTPQPTGTPTPLPTTTNTPTSIPTPLNSPTGPPTTTIRPTLTPAPDDPFELAQSVALCDNTANGVLRVYVRDWQGNGVPGVELMVSWPGGQDTFFTGFKTKINPGYADFQMTPDQTYQVELVNLPASTAKGINDAAPSRCLNLPSGIAPSWQVVFQQGASR